PAANFPASIIAGYPWFADWGRDTMISLPGLLLCTGRHEEARSLLLLFSAARGGGPAGSEQSGGLVPNVFDDYTGRPHYNTVDASLWFVHACCRYLAASKDQSTFNKELLPACLDVMHAYRTGTAFGIGADPEDGLIASGDHTTQLTWMDAKRDGVVFTPRHGKAIEINALYYNALRSLAVAAGPHRTGLRNEMTALADKIGPTIATRFWNPQRQCLFDCLTPDHAAPGGWRPSTQVRPNQIFAVSLPHSPLNPSQQQAVVKCVRERLWTRHGLRTLEQGDAGYKGRFEGRMFDRDAAYHNGTAWPWLAGPLAEATLRAGGFSSEARAQARELLAPLLRAMEGGCLGQLAEVYDGDDTTERPQRAAGCPAQAWSIAETLRVSLLIERGE
ncbi:MAG: glycogen debranching protein, partial [Phycisphaerales bacterium]|nr:glycogen debranching protein [Phycisphaerales bacterium]